MEDKCFVEVCIISHTDRETQEPSCDRKVGYIDSKQNLSQGRLDVKLANQIPRRNEKLKCNDPGYLRVLSELEILAEGSSKASMPGNFNEQDNLNFIMSVGNRDSQYLLATNSVTRLVSVAGPKIVVLGSLSKGSYFLAPWAGGILRFYYNQQPTFINLKTFAEKPILNAPAAKLYGSCKVQSTASHVYYMDSESVLRIDKSLKVEVFTTIREDRRCQPDMSTYQSEHSMTEGIEDFFYCSKSGTATLMFFRKSKKLLMRGNKVVPVRDAGGHNDHWLPWSDLIKKMHSDHFLVTGNVEGEHFTQYLDLWDYRQLKELDRIEFSTGSQLAFVHTIRLLAPRKQLNGFLVVAEALIGLFCESRGRLQEVHSVQTSQQQHSYQHFSYLKKGLWAMTFRYRKDSNKTWMALVQLGGISY